jgi:hypothetical protein
VIFVTGNGKPALDVHNETIHNGCKRSKQKRNNDSPTSSPPRKKENIDIDGKDDSVEMMDIEIDSNGVVIEMLENRIKQLEKIKDNLEKEIVQLKLKQNGNVKDTNRPPKHLSKVHAAHLSKLKEYSWRYVADANGASATNSLAVAIHEDEDEGPKLKRRTLDHIADHYPTYYVNKKGLPYVETVGVGVDSKVVTKETDEEMVAFLRSEEAMTVFAHTHELLAVANMHNIRIHVFSYGGSKDGWSEVPPDLHMVALVGSASGQWVPEVALYHSYDSHYDLLVKRESRIALLGLLAGSADKANKVEAEECKGRSEDEWTTVLAYFLASYAS